MSQRLFVQGPPNSFLVSGPAPSHRRQASLDLHTLFGPQQNPLLSNPDSDHRPFSYLAQPLDLRFKVYFCQPSIFSCFILSPHSKSSHSSDYCPSILFATSLRLAPSTHYNIRPGALATATTSSLCAFNTSSSPLTSPRTQNLTVAIFHQTVSEVVQSTKPLVSKFVT